jgi:O-methyltransferase
MIPAYNESGPSASGELSRSAAAAVPQRSPLNRSAGLYLDLMKRCLTNWVYGNAEEEVLWPVNPQDTAAGIRLVRSAPFDPGLRTEGRDFPRTAHTMIGLKRLDNLQVCVEDVLQRGVPGDLIETGVWRGGATIFMRAILQAYGDRERRVWVADSFRGLPSPNSQKYPWDAGDVHHQMPELAVSLEDVQANFQLYGLLDEQVHFLKGWFRDTLPSAPIGRLAILRLDGDMYESTMDALVHLYPKLSVGGYVIVDDYGYIESCRRAVRDYRDAHGITDEIHPVDWTGVWWQRSN